MLIENKGGILVEMFIILAVVVVLTGIGLKLYFDEPIQTEGAGYYEVKK